VCVCAYVALLAVLVIERIKRYTPLPQFLIIIFCFAPSLELRLRVWRRWILILLASVFANVGLAGVHNYFIPF